MTRMLCALAAALLSVALSGCGNGPAVQTSRPEAPKAIVVSTAPVTTRHVQADFQETGTFMADESSDVAPPVAGRVVATPVNAGDRVKQGQVICELDHRDAQLKLDQARAQLQEATAALRQVQSRIGWSSGTFDPNQVPEVAAARANYQSAQAQAKMAAADSQRYANLVATGDVSHSAFEKAHTQQETAEAQANAARQQYEAAANAARQSYEVISTSQASLEGVKAQLAQAEKALADTIIRAPFDGFVAARPVAAGEYVALTNKIATIVKTGTLKLYLQTPEQRAAVAHVGDTVFAHVSAYPAREFQGKVSAVNPSVDSNSRVFILEAKFSNTDNALKPGMFATARVLLPGGVEGLFVAKSAVIRDKTTDSHEVWAIQNGKARLRIVTVGDADETDVRILTGLNANETIALNNQAELFDGAAVSSR
ncbi:MAG: efflux transporter, family, subunit [Bryobacterales bacterium]|nr:efflux transporter, family, subunit [Bryobacterales bacterium]